MELKGKVAIVTGGSRGIGKGIVLALARAGADVAIFYRVKSEEAQKVVDEIKGLDRKGFAVQVDITDYDKVEEAVGSVIGQFGKVDILVNNAGRQPRATSDGDRDLRDWKGVIDLNLNAAFYCTKAVLKQMRERRSGVIINISSADVRMLVPTSGPYAASKCGIDAFTKVLAKEEAIHGIRVNGVAPGYTDTGMFREMLKALGQERAKEEVARIPLGRLGLPEDIGHAVVFLCSEMAAYITGEILHVSGGLAM
jgi:3-oxoacyl-[acyl-carrier protein] reductase